MVESRKDGGVFSKRTRARGYRWISAVGSQSGGSDLISTWLLILRVHSGSDGREPSRVWGRRRSPEQGLPQRGIAEVSQSGAPGVNSSRVLVVEHRHGMCNPLATLAGLEEVRGGTGSCGGGSARRSSPARGMQSVPVRETGCKRLVEPLRSKSKPVRGLRGAAQRCRVLTTASSRCGGGTAPACRHSETLGMRQGLQASAEGSGAREGAHRALDWMEAWRRGRRRRAPVMAQEWSSRTGMLQGAPGVWIPRLGSGSIYESERWVREA